MNPVTPPCQIPSPLVTLVARGCWRGLRLLDLFSVPLLSQDPDSLASERGPLSADLADVRAVLEGNDEAYSRLVQRHQREVRRQMRRFSRDHLVCDELVHDVFVEAWKSLKHFKGHSPWAHWLRKVAVRVGYRHWKTAAKAPAPEMLTELDTFHPRSSPVESLVPSEAADMLHRMLAKLRPSDRLVLTLHYLEGFTLAEVAAHAGWTVAGTKLRAFRARNKLKSLCGGVMR